MRAVGQIPAGGIKSVADFQEVLVLLHWNSLHSAPPLRAVLHQVGGRLGPRSQYDPASY